MSLVIYIVRAAQVYQLIVWTEGVNTQASKGEMWDNALSCGEAELCAMGPLSCDEL